VCHWYSHNDVKVEMFFEMFTKKRKAETSWVNKYSTLCYGPNKFRSKNVLNKSHNKLQWVTLCVMIVFCKIFEWLLHLCTPHTIIYKVPQSSSEFQTQIQAQRPGTFSNASQRRTPIDRWVKKRKDIEYPFEHGEVTNYTLDVYQ
jgi:hypothetical protein